MIAATTGSILVLMKKNSASWVLRTGCSDSANAAGMPSASTRTVDTTVANSEFSSARADALVEHRPELVQGRARRRTSAWWCRRRPPV